MSSMLFKLIATCLGDCSVMNAIEVDSMDGGCDVEVFLGQLVRFLVVELTYLDLNPRFDMDVVFMTNYSFSGRRRLR
jgi:hypothetical protein